MNKENIKNLYDEVSKDGYDLEELKNLDTETLLDEDREVWVKYKWHKQKLTKSNKEAVRGFVEELMKIKADDNLFDAFALDVKVVGLHNAINKRVEQYLKEQNI